MLSSSAVRRDAHAICPSRPDIRDPRDVNISQALIARRAYQIWESNGRPEVISDQVWIQAKSELRRQQV